MKTEWWQRGPVDGVPAVLQPVAHILLQVQESTHELTDGLSETDWNARPAGVASPAFHVRHMAGVIDRLFTYARGESLSDEQRDVIKREGDPLNEADVPSVLRALDERVEKAVNGCLVHGAEHAMRHVGQLSVTARVARQL